jgi:hypothetical protein
VIRTLLIALALQAEIMAVGHVLMKPAEAVAVGAAR